MRRFKTFTSLIICVFCMLILSSCKYIFEPFYKYVFKPYNEINEELPDNLNSSKSIAEYAKNIVEKDCDKEFNIGSVDMHLDSELKGDVEVILVEKKQKKPLLVYVDFDTKNNKLLSFQYVTWNSKAHPGVINMHKWKIDYEEAIELSKEFYSKTQGFRYDSVWIETCNSHKEKDEDWSVILNDEQSWKRYYTRIDPYTGEIFVHSIWEH